MKILDELDNIERRNEFTVIAGDLNRKIGNIVENNDDEISLGGQMVKDLINTGKYILINGTKKCKGGVNTRIDLSDSRKGSCFYCFPRTEKVY